MITFAATVVAAAIGFICGRLYRKDEAVFWEQKAREYCEGWTAANLRAAELQRELEAARRA